MTTTSGLLHAQAIFSVAFPLFLTGLYNLCSEAGRYHHEICQAKHPCENKAVHCSHVGTFPHHPLEEDEGRNTVQTHTVFHMASQQWDKSLWSTEKPYTSANTNVNKN